MKTIYCVAISAVHLPSGRNGVAATGFVWVPYPTENEARFAEHLDATAKRYFPLADGWAHHITAIAAVTPEMLAQVQA